MTKTPTHLPVFDRKPSSIFKASLVGIAISMLNSVSALAQNQLLPGGFNYPTDRSPAPASEFLKQGKDAFYNFAFEPIPQAKQNNLPSQNFIPPQRYGNGNNLVRPIKYPSDSQILPSRAAVPTTEHSLESTHGFDRTGFNPARFKHTGFEQNASNGNNLVRPVIRSPQSHALPSQAVVPTTEHALDSTHTFDQAGFNQAEFGETGFNQAEFGETGFDQAEFGETGFDQAEFGETGFDQVEIGQAGFAQSRPALPTVPPIFADPTNRHSADSPLLGPYHARVASRQNDNSIDPNIANVDALGFRGWWADEVASPVGLGSGSVQVSVDMLVENALRHSPQIQIAATAPHIFQNTFFEAASEFDWTSFLESQYNSLNDPIGNTLTTGNNDSRFRQQEWSARGGLRRATQTGGEVEVSQRLGHLDNNSQFLIPANQGSSRLELNFRQPILNGRGRAVNQSLIVLADIDFRAASDDFLTDLQLHLVSVTEAYWELVRSRAVFLQRKRLLKNAEEILSKLEGRSEVDALQRQILRARAAVAQRRSEIARAVTSIKNAQSQLRLLVNSPEISSTGGLEFTPLDLPTLGQAPLHIELADVMSTALTNRPDISRAIRDLHAANVRLGVARNDILPRLDMVLGTYVAGLDGDSDVFDAWTNQFTQGTPGFNVGFEYEFAIGNRAAQARQARRQWEVARSLHMFRQTVENSLTEVEVAAREVQTTYQEMLGRYHSMVASDKEMSYLVDRWKTLPELNDSVTLLLEDLLDSQERLADEESSFVNAQVQYSVAIVRLKQTMGTLFRVSQ